MSAAQQRYEEAIRHLRQAQRLMGGLMYAISDDADRICLDGCFQGLASECEEVARYQLGLEEAGTATAIFAAARSTDGPRRQLR